jgi:hypothetical protein
VNFDQPAVAGFGSHFGGKARPVWGAMCAGGHNNPNGIRGNAPLTQLFKNRWQDLAGARRAREVINDDRDPAYTSSQIGKARGIDRV